MGVSSSSLPIDVGAEKKCVHKNRVCLSTPGIHQCLLFFGKILLLLLSLYTQTLTFASSSTRTLHQKKERDLRLKRKHARNVFDKSVICAQLHNY
jgi:hypothetical protein